MRFGLTPGYVVGFAVNAHRAKWNGTICRDAATWNCGADQAFREEHCAVGNARCFHINLMNPSGPCAVLDDNAADWVFTDTRDVLNNQLLVFWDRPAQEPHGIREAGQVYHMVGAYRVQRVERVSISSRSDRSNWVIHPYADDWVRLDQFRIVRSSYEDLGGKYVKQMAPASVRFALDEALRKSEDPTRAIAEDEQRRIRRFSEQFDGWLQQAKDLMVALRKQHATVIVPAPTQVSRHQPLRGLPEQIAKKDRLNRLQQQFTTATADVTAKPAPAIDKPSATSAHPDVGLLLPEASVRESLLKRHGDEVVRALQIGSMSKLLLLLRGRPGVGKSDLATSLLDDPTRERTLVVAVSSTWRGRGDLLGHVNLVSGEFEPSDVAEFLRRAEMAWNAGDRRPRLVIFEEFNLSQPEFWLSDILVRSQFSESSPDDRTITLGGASVRGWGEARPRIFLAPSVRFVGTINNDQTVKSLSPRVLDRAAVIELMVSPRAALERIGVRCSDQLVEAITALDQRIAMRGASFSYRTAISLGRALARHAELGMTAEQVVDWTLSLEVLSKLRLSYADPLDLQLCDLLVRWSETEGRPLERCGRIIEGWRSQLEAHQDVEQA